MPAAMASQLASSNEAYTCIIMIKVCMLLTGFSYS